MPLTTPDTVFPASARAMQEKFGSRSAYARVEARGFPREITPELAGFLAQLNGFYIATATPDGKPYIQHRGGPRGFLRPLGPATLGFADFSGNRQYITLGRLSENGACCLFLMDYVHQRRIKIWGRARIVETDDAPISALADPTYRARIERAVVIEIDAWSENCSKHIPQRFDAEDVAQAIAALEERITNLESENVRLHEQLAGEITAVPPTFQGVGE